MLPVGDEMGNEKGTDLISHRSRRRFDGRVALGRGVERKVKACAVLTCCFLKRDLEASRSTSEVLEFSVAVRVEGSAVTGNAVLDTRCEESVGPNAS